VNFLIRVVNHERVESVKLDEKHQYVEECQYQADSVETAENSGEVKDR